MVIFGSATEMWNNLLSIEILRKLLPLINKVHFISTGLLLRSSISFGWFLRAIPAMLLIFLAESQAESNEQQN